MRRSVAEMRGVTLVEMAIVLLILGILARATIAPLSSLQQHRHQREAESQLESIRHALWAHVVSAGVLPCPVLLGSGSAVTDSDSVCLRFSGGVPAVELGLPGPVDSDGALLDPWGRPYQLAVSLFSHDQQGIPAEPDWTTEGEASRIGIAELAADLVVCSQSVTGRCSAKSVRASELSFVVFSSGSDSSSAGDQSENLDGDKVFALQEHSVDTERPFDDLLWWGTASESGYWLVRAGWLPGASWWPPER